MTRPGVRGAAGSGGGAGVSAAAPAPPRRVQEARVTSDRGGSVWPCWPPGVPACLPRALRELRLGRATPGGHTGPAVRLASSPSLLAAVQPGRAC